MIAFRVVAVKLGMSYACSALIKMRAISTWNNAHILLLKLSILCL